MDQTVQRSDVCVTCQKTSMRPSGWVGQEAGESFEVMHCSSCGGFSSNPIPSKGILDDYYSHKFSYNWYRLHKAGKRRDSMERAEEMKALLGKRVLDLGGGLGYLAEILKQQGYDAEVYDPYADSTVTRPNSSTFDTVVCLHVLEHTPDPLEFLRSAAQFLIPGGRLILAVPNAAGTGYRERGMGWVWAQPPVLHIHHFTADGLTKLLRRAGFGDFQVSFHERWDANSESDLKSSYWPRALRAINRVPFVRQVDLVQQILASVDIWRRFKQVAKAKRSNVPASDRAEIVLAATLMPQ